MLELKKICDKKNIYTYLLYCYSVLKCAFFLFNQILRLAHHTNNNIDHQPKIITLMYKNRFIVISPP